jgi:hypothetical protein
LSSFRSHTQIKSSTAACLIRAGSELATAKTLWRLSTRIRSRVQVCCGSEDRHDDDDNDDDDDDDDDDNDDDDDDDED